MVRWNSLLHWLWCPRIVGARVPRLLRILRRLALLRLVVGLAVVGFLLAIRLLATLEARRLFLPVHVRRGLVGGLLLLLPRTDQRWIQRSIAPRRILLFQAQLGAHLVHRHGQLLKLVPLVLVVRIHTGPAEHIAVAQLGQHILAENILVVGQDRAQALVLRVGQALGGIGPGQRRLGRGERFKVDFVGGDAVHRADDGRQKGHPLREIHFVEFDTEILERRLRFLVLGHHDRHRPRVVHAFDHAIPIALEGVQVGLAVVAREVQHALGDRVVGEPANIQGHGVEESGHHLDQQLRLRQAIPGGHHI